MSKFATYNPVRLNIWVVGWLLAQTFWVGGLWLLKFVVLPALSRLGLAPLLVDYIATSVAPLLVSLAACCAAFQALVLVRAERRLSSLWQDIRGQLLLLVLVMAGSYLIALQVWPDALRWMLFNYLVMAFCGLMLVLQPAPVRRG